jgi:hypothetical protein
VFVPHRLIDTPPDETRIWRYLDFTKLVSLFETCTLRLTRGDKFEDRFEAAVPVGDRAAGRDYFARALEQPEIDIEGVSRFRRDDVRPYVQALLDLTDAQLGEISDEELPRYMLRLTNRFLYLNCWHINDVESAGMWDLYAQNGEGLAVQSTVGRLKRSLALGDAHEALYIGRVRYLDYDRESWGEFTPLSQAFHKRSSFEHERELRVVAMNPRHLDSRRSTYLNVPVDLGVLLEALHVSPRAPGWFHDLVAAVARRYQQPAPVLQSNLYADPEF